MSDNSFLEDVKAVWTHYRRVAVLYVIAGFCFATILIGSLT